MVKSERIKEIKQPKIKIPYVSKTKIPWPDKASLEAMIKSQSVLSISKSLGVSDNSVRKRAKAYGINIQELSLWSKRHGLPNTKSNNSPNNPKS
jgi:hypothetical protein